MKMRRLFGMSYLGTALRLLYDRRGWWITDASGYRNTLHAALVKSTDSEGFNAQRLILWRFAMELGWFSRTPKDERLSMPHQSRCLSVCRPICKKCGGRTVAKHRWGWDLYDCRWIFKCTVCGHKQEPPCNET